MIIDFDHNPALTTDQKLQSLAESIQLGMNELSDLMYKQQKLTESMQKAIASLEAVAKDAILQSNES